METNQLRIIAQQQENGEKHGNRRRNRNPSINQPRQRWINHKANANANQLVCSRRGWRISSATIGCSKWIWRDRATPAVGSGWDLLEGPCCRTSRPSRRWWPSRRWSTESTCAARLAALRHRTCCRDKKETNDTEIEMSIRAPSASAA